MYKYIRKCIIICSKCMTDSNIFGKVATSLRWTDGFFTELSPRPIQSISGDISPSFHPSFLIILPSKHLEITQKREATLQLSWTSKTYPCTDLWLAPCTIFWLNNGSWVNFYLHVLDFPKIMSFLDFFLSAHTFQNAINFLTIKTKKKNQVASHL